ncbi:MAG: hypothetical protein GY888_21180, partial [Planctomycetaceae bacterium]|nr:hypothetical protein [Planctomycetaceae bacterium]
KKPTILSTGDLGLSAEQLTSRIVLNKQYVPEVQGNCEFIAGSPAEVARTLIDKLRTDNSI